MTYTLEDYLAELHTGQWFGWSNSKNKIYANVVIHSNDLKPTEQECTDGVTALQAEYDSKQYARDRAEAYPSLPNKLIWLTGIDRMVLQLLMMLLVLLRFSSLSHKDC